MHSTDVAAGDSGDDDLALDELAAEQIARSWLDQHRASDSFRVVSKSAAAETLPVLEALLGSHYRTWQQSLDYAGGSPAAIAVKNYAVVLDEAAKLVADCSDDHSDGLLTKIEAWKNLLEMHEVGAFFFHRVCLCSSFYIQLFLKFKCANWMYVYSTVYHFHSRTDSTLVKN
jgi:hypothetical protein